MIPLFAVALMAANPAAPDATANLRVVDRVCAIVARRYWDTARLSGWDESCDRARIAGAAARDEAQLYRVLDRLLAGIGDSHVFAVDPAERRFSERRDIDEVGEFGFSSEEREGGWWVFGIDRDGPAGKAGVEIGWRLVSVNGAPPDKDYHPRPGEQARLRFVDETGRPHDYTLTGTILTSPDARRAERLPNDILHLSLDEFTPGADAWLRDEIDQAQPRAVILDLRENFGGEATAIARVAGALFNRKGTLLTRQGRGKAIDVPMLGAGPRAYTGPLAVLVGPRSASGAEVIAALVEESGRGLTIGQRTAGALTGAALYDLPGGGQLSVAVFDIRTPGGHRLEKQGFTPARIVEPSLADLRAGRDPVLSAAVRALTRDRGTSPARTTPATTEN